MLTVADTADRFDVSRRTVLRWIERGDLVALRLPGGRLRITSAEIERVESVWCTIAPDNASAPARLTPPGAGRRD
jgi:excisionase family DNA binding protein